MPENEWQTIYREEARILGKIGAVLVRADMPEIEVRLPRGLVEAAVSAWERVGDESAGPIDETCEQRLERHRAAALSLVGLSITERGRWQTRRWP